MRDALAEVLAEVPHRNGLQRGVELRQRVRPARRQLATRLASAFVLGDDPLIRLLFGHAELSPGVLPSEIRDARRLRPGDAFQLVRLARRDLAPRSRARAPVQAFR